MTLESVDRTYLRTLYGKVSTHRLRTIWYVDATHGNNNNSGRSAGDPFVTIAAAIAVALTGDMIMVAAGTYDEALNLNVQGAELIFEEGVVLQNTAPGTVLIVSANYCLVKNGLFTASAGQTNIQSTAAYCILEDCQAFSGAVGFDIDSATNIMRRCYSLTMTSTGFDISEATNQLFDCISIGDNSSRGFYFSHGNADRNTLVNCWAGYHGVGAGQAAYEAVAGADNNVFAHCGMADTDRVVDGGANNTWAEFSEGSQITAGQSRDQDLKDIFDATNEVPIWATPTTGSHTTTDVTEEDVVEITLTDPYRFWMYIDLVNMVVNDDFTFRVYVKVDGTNYRLKSEQQFLGAQTLDVYEIDGLYGDTACDIKVTVQRASGTDRAFPYRYNYKKEV